MTLATSTRRTALTLAAILTAAAVARADGPAATRPTSPKAQMIAWGKAAPTQTVDEVAAEMNTTTDEEKAFAKVVAAEVVETSKLQVAVRDKFGVAGEATVLHAIGQDTAADDEAATEKVDGDTAVVTFDQDGLAPLKMVKVDGGWKIDLHALVAGAPDLDGPTKASVALTDLFHNAAAGVKAGKYDSADDMAAKLKAAVAKMSGQG